MTIIYDKIEKINLPNDGCTRNGRIGFTGVYVLHTKEGLRWI